MSDPHPTSVLPEGYDPQAITRPHNIAISEAFLRRLPSWTDEMGGRLRHLHAEPGSKLAYDDSFKVIDRPSEQVIYLLRNSWDHLALVAHSVSTDHVRPFACFSLVRVAIEAAALASWLIVGGTTDSRLNRSIRFTWDSRRRVDTAVAALGVEPRDQSKQVRDSLDASKARRPGTKNLNYDKGIGTISDVVIGIDKKLKRTKFNGIDAWRACSGIAHSNIAFGRSAVFETHQGTALSVSANPVVLAMMLEPAERHFDFALNTAERMCAPQKGRS